MSVVEADGVERTISIEGLMNCLLDYMYVYSKGSMCLHWVVRYVYICLYDRKMTRPGQDFWCVWKSST